MLGDISGVEAIYIICGYTDMRKSIDGLCDIVQDYLKVEPEQNCLYLFCGRKKDRIKALLIEDDGITLLYKRLTGIGNYKWSRNKDEVRNLTWKQFTVVTRNNLLMEGLEIDQPKAIR